ncbi:MULTISPECIES: CobW family GTP-binding protein [unclassified Mesorhizobium]|uniref:CobW family GTP-binding protein n=1 Tax=unclassified Mesorhizobium TaxID=325217 RepID=UPI0011265404|nr:MULTISPECIES: CobW family GTP-binding protein [unclassified Mesorhizobium]TPI18317.1 GTP-binding protein [Mesorhizobium sp. B4-1-1]TPL46483.1 GTP-binding protein [Mesorhizobium sp. B2-4-6]
MNALPDPKSLRLAREETAPVAVLTGFLGSGKTTLVRRLLALPQAADTAVIVNEFGEIGLDHLLVETVDENIVVLPGGCLCCQAQGDMARALRSLDEAVAAGGLPPFRRVIIETSGLADPAPLLQAFLADPLRLSRYRLAALVATADGVLGPDGSFGHAVAQAQLALADRVLMTKLDIAGEAGEAGARRALDALGVTSVEPAASNDALIAQLFAPAPAFRARCAMSMAAAGHSCAFASLAMDVPARLDLSRLLAALEAMASRHGENLARLKGIVDVSGDARPVAIHAVRHMVALPRFLEAVAPTAPRAIVAIFPAEAGDAIREDLRDLVADAGTPCSARG